MPIPNYYPLTAEELILQLQALPPNTVIYVWGDDPSYEGLVSPTVQYCEPDDGIKGFATIAPDYCYAEG